MCALLVVGKWGVGGLILCYLHVLKAINMQIYSMYYWTKNGVDLSELELSTIIWDYLLVYIIYRRGILLNRMVKIYKV